MPSNAASYTAIFLDRDGTLSRNAPLLEMERDCIISALIGQEFQSSYETRMEFFWEVWAMPGMSPVATLEGEDRFWQRWYQCILERYDVGDAETWAADLHQKYCYYHMMELYPESLTVVQALHGREYRLGVISDTFPSLEESIRHLGIAEYFSSFTASSLVGAGKPDPRIFNAALGALGVTAGESIFVDDTLV
ncbi:MAG TPA: HAD-IA family hydrolase, partial [Armatimonadota bacterium]